MARFNEILVWNISAMDIGKISYDEHNNTTTQQPPTPITSCRPNRDYQLQRNHFAILSYHNSTTAKSFSNTILHVTCIFSVFVTAMQCGCCRRRQNVVKVPTCVGLPSYVRIMLCFYVAVRARFLWNYKSVVSCRSDQECSCRCSVVQYCTRCRYLGQ